MTSPDTRGSLIQALIARLGPTQEGGLRIGGIPAGDIAERFGTPAYVYDADILRDNVKSVREALGPRVEVLFALKANPNAAVARVLRLAGAGAEVASAGEILVAQRAGFRGEDIQFAGPGKHGSDLELSFRHRLSALNVESVAEYEAIADLATRERVRPSIAIRVNPQESLCGSRMQMGGGSKKFGLDAEAVPPLARRIREEDVCDLRGLHVYAGTQSFDAGAWVENARGLVSFANQIERDEGLSLRTLNFGGGLGVPVFEGDTPIDLAALGSGVRELIDADARPDRRYFVELGRYLTATAGVYLTRVLYLKRSGERRHLILDGGMHHHAAAAGLGTVIRRAFPIVVARAPTAEATDKYTLGGPLCTPADEFAANLRLPPVRSGDLIGILGSGAYGLTFSNALFLSHPLPAEVMVEGGESHVIRARGLPEDALRGQSDLPDTGNETART